MITRDATGADTKPTVASGGRHHVTVLFSDLSSSSRLAQAVEPEVNIHIIDTIIAKAVDIIGKHGGVVNQCHGDGVLAVFGFPKIQEDDVRRATEAALELHRVVAGLTFDALGVPGWFSPSMHSGIDSGLVVIGDGDWIQGQYKVSGPAANTAAALSGVATANEIIASASTLRGVLPFFSTKEHAPLALKDKGASVAAYSVLERSGISTRFEARAQRGLTAFFGRAAELESVQHALLRACKGNLEIVNIVGAAGLGKSRVVEEFLRRMEVGCSVYRGYCESYGGVAPLQPFLHMLRQLFELDDVMSTQDSRQALQRRLAELDAELVAQQDTLLRMLSLRSEPSESRNVNRAGPDMGGALIALFAKLAEQQPLVLIIDDWQWADEASRQVLGSVIRALQNAPALVVTASRELETRVPAMAEANVVQLEPFNEVDSARKIRALLPQSLEAGISRIQQLSGGNALFMEELCESSPTETLDGGSSETSSHIPKWLFGLIETRIQQLPEEQAQLVRVAAVIGNVTPFWLLERISGYHEQDAIFRQLAANDVLAAGEIKGTLRFKHGITRDAIYELVGQPHKRQLHLRIAQTLKAYYSPARRPEQYETLAYHYAGGGDFPRAFCYAQRAGKKAMAASFLGNARTQYLAALDALGMLSQTAKVRRLWIEVSLRWALACIYAPARDQLQILQRTADYARELDDLNGLAHAHYWLGYIHYGLGEQTEAINHCQQALALAEELGNSRLVAQLLAVLGQSFAAAADYPQALPHLDRAIKAKDRRSRGSSLPVGSVYAMGCKGQVVGDSGDFEEAHKCIQWALGAVGGTGHEIEASTLAVRGIVLLWQGRWQEVVDDAQRTQVIAERVSAPYVFAMSRALGGYARWKLDAATAGIESLRSTAEWLEAREIRLFISLTYGWLADALAAAGEDQEAFEYGQRALDRACDHDSTGEAMACRALARVSARSLGSKWPAPEQYLQMALQSARKRGSRHEEAVTQLHQAEVYAALDQPDEAVQLLTNARRAFADMDMHWHDARAAELARRLDPATR